MVPSFKTHFSKPFSRHTIFLMIRFFFLVGMTMALGLEDECRLKLLLFFSASTRKIFCDPTFSKNKKWTNNFSPSDSIVYIRWVKVNHLQFCNSANLERFFATSNLCLVSFLPTQLSYSNLSFFSRPTQGFSDGDCPPLPIIPLHNKKVRISSFSILCSVPPSLCSAGRPVWIFSP